MSDLIQIAEKTILSPSEISSSAIEQVFQNMSSYALDEAELYFQSSYYESWSLEDGEVNDGSYNYDQGVGVRAIAGEKTGYAYSDEVHVKALQDAASAAKAIASQGQKNAVKVDKYDVPTALYPTDNPIDGISVSEKLAILTKVDQLARQMDQRIIRVDASLVGAYDVVLIMTSNDQVSADARPLVRVNISVMAESNGRREKGYSGGGGRYSFKELIESQLIDELTKEAVNQAVTNLDAEPAPAGSMPVVLGPGWPGILLHEAVGHGLEGDFNRKELSAFSGRIGERVAAPGVTVIDDGTLQGKRGSLTIDDEGTASKRTVLIEDGILKGYMCDKLNARLLNMSPTGNGRRESYAHQPMPRMTNTFMLGGHYDPEEIIASVDKGIYATNFGGGQVDITSGKFVFSANGAYLIENGKITKPIKGATLIGHGPEALKYISMIGNDLKLDSGVGVCGKEGQSVPVGVGLPTIKIDQMTVGGTQQEESHDD